MIPTRPLLPLLASFAAIGCFAAALPQTPPEDISVRHQSSEWLLVAPHLPDPATATPAALQTAADVLRARRMPEDALDFYQYALSRGGDEATISNRIGITLLELRHPELARVALRRALQRKPKDPQTWNNLGAAEYVMGNYQAAIANYLKAVKFDKKTAVYHSNLGTAYFEVKDVESARSQFAKAVKLDPNVFQRGDWGGIQAHVLSPTDRGQFCLEMARLSARQHDDEGVLRWLGKAVDAGFDVHSAIAAGKDFEPYRKDPRVAVIIRNAKAMKPGQLAAVASPVQPLPSNP